MGRTERELAEVLTVAELSRYQALVEIDGPWWGEREAALLQQLCSVQAAAGGADIPPEEFKIQWRVGPAAVDPPAGRLLPPNDGIAIFAARYGLPVIEG
jgi:hypothetical protein